MPCGTSLIDSFVIGLHGRLHAAAGVAVRGAGARPVRQRVLADRSGPGNSSPTPISSCPRERAPFGIVTTS